MRILLDTSTFIWWANQHKNISPELLATLKNPSNTIYLSLVSIWEMQIKSQLGKLTFNVPLEQLVNEQEKENRLILLPILDSHIYALSELPQHHKDPFDRLLIAQARIEQLHFATRDRQVQNYEVDILWL